MRYTFKCKECGFVFSEQLRVKDYTEKMELQTIKCPDCGTNNVIRQYVPVGVHYKSAGFYSIDQDLDDPAVADVMDTSRGKNFKKKKK